MNINLQKGQKIDLTKKTGVSLTNFCVGCNWGAIETIDRREVIVNEGIFGIGRKTEWREFKQESDVDLDLSCILVDNNGDFCDHIYSPLYKKELLAKFGLPPGKLQTANFALTHSGDDREGDTGGDDGLDNEIITIDLSKLPSNVSQIFFFLNNCGKEDFAQIPYAKIRMYEGTSTHVKEVFAQYDVAAEKQYSQKRALIMGKLYKKEEQWKFHAIGDATEDAFLGQTIQRIINSYI